MSIKHLYPTSTPSLNLNFKSSGVADPRLSCVRNSIGTYVDPASGLVKTAPDNVARVGEDGLLVEETRDNQLPYSEDYSNWTLWNTTTAPSVSEPAPDGSTTCRKLTEGTTSAFTLMGEGSNMVNSTTYTYSFYIKKPGTNAARYCLVRTQGNSSPEICTFDMDTLDASNKPTVNVPSTPVATNIDFDVLPNGWFRFYCTFPCNAAGSNREMQIGINETDSITLQTYLGDGTSGFLVWGAQLEAGSFPTSYIPTSGSTVQRLRDQIDVGIDNWWNDTEGTIVLEADYSQTSNTMTLYSADLGSGIKHRLLQEGASIRYTMRNTGGSTVFNFSQTASPEKTAFGYATDNLRFAYDNALSPLDTSGTPPTGILYFRIGRDNNNSNPLLAGHIKRLTFYSTRASDTALQSLTL